MKKKALMTLLCLFTAVSLAHAGSIILIANKGVAASTLSRDDVQRIFLGKKTTWDDGKKISPVILKGGFVHEQFLKTYLDKNVSQFDTFWKQVMFTGKGKTPKSVPGDAEMVWFVGNTDGAVGYIDSDTPHGDVKKLDLK